MTKFIFIRHGQANYKDVDDRNFIGHGQDLAPLSELGEEQVKEASKDSRLIASEIIISSPYTRALQSAAIISKELNIDIKVEVALHEWLPDIINFQNKTTEDSIVLYKDYKLNDGIYPENEEKVWETTKHMENRIDLVLEKYKHYSQVIVVSHSLVLKTQSSQENISNGEIIQVEKL